MTKMLGGERVVQMLEAEGVDTVFGIIDGSYFGLYSRLRDHGIRLITPRHETTAVHMAGAYARLTGRLGVCIASNGPGVANALPGVAVENGEGNRVLLLTSWRRSPIVAPDRGGTYQYFDQVAVTRPMTKWSGAAMSYERVPEMLRRALRISWHGRPGVVHVCIPEDVLNGEFETPVAPDPVPARSRRQTPVAPDPTTVRRAADMLADAEFPMIHVGSGVLHAGASAELREVAELLRAPVTTSWGARDVIDERSLVSIPMPYVELIKRVRNDADVVLAVGTRFGETDWWGKPPHWRAAAEQQVIQVDVDEEMLGLNKPIDLGIVADARAFLTALIGELAERDFSHRAVQREDTLREYAAVRRDARAALDAARTAVGAPMHSAHVAPICQEVFADDAVLVIDGGNTAIWANLYHEARVPHTLLSTWKFGMLGACMGQALGAQAAFPDRQVYCITGDGAMGFHPQELETAIRNHLPVVFIVLSDRAWGMVKVNQEFAIDADRLLTDGELPDEAHINTDLGEIRWDLLAQSMGAHGERVVTPDELRPALERCVAAGRCAVVQVDVDPVAHKFAPNLLTFKEMHAEPAG
jgi:Thiamine pyrophosphate-requiring enzymes [acetolactate synthase, pyruvate dehydrogenase (cytochrome), glyoxylate carboligase, phosphonopyruvate decarboxylase]